ncbi:hypothetical protein MTO96_039436 [Rhipicephalus appendiculatus]
MAPFWKGRKYSFEISMEAHKWLSFNRNLAKKADTEDQERCLLDSVDCLSKTLKKTNYVSDRKDPTSGVVRYFRRTDLRLPQQDEKGGFFAAMPSELFRDKATAAAQKNG